jgi:hypothetical protein
MTQPSDLCCDGQYVHQAEQLTRWTAGDWTTSYSSDHGAWGSRENSRPHCRTFLTSTTCKHVSSSTTNVRSLQSSRKVISRRLAGVIDDMDYSRRHAVCQTCRSFCPLLPSGCCWPRVGAPYLQVKQMGQSPFMTVDQALPVFHQGLPRPSQALTSMIDIDGRCNDGRGALPPPPHHDHSG